MGILKEMVARGSYYIETGTADLDSWSKLMIDDLGPNVKPYLKDIMEWSIVLAHKKADASNLKRNCWDYYRCRKQSEGNHVKEHDVCPAYFETKLHGIHDGKNGGRACWIVAGTKCGGRIKRTLVPKFIVCKLCGFKKIVISEESQNFVVSDDFMKNLMN
jgi:hypothetical protein